MSPLKHFKSRIYMEASLYSIIQWSKTWNILEPEQRCFWISRDNYVTDIWPEHWGDGQAVDQRGRRPHEDHHHEDDRHDNDDADHHMVDQQGWG